MKWFTFDIGVHTWDVIFEEVLEEGFSVHGETDPNSHTIRLNPDLLKTETHLYSVLLHEMIHAAHMSLGYDWPEAAVYSMELALGHALKNLITLPAYPDHILQSLESGNLQAPDKPAFDNDCQGSNKHSTKIPTPHPSHTMPDETVKWLQEISYTVER